MIPTDQTKPVLYGRKGDARMRNTAALLGILELGNRQIVEGRVQEVAVAFQCVRIRRQH